MFRRIWMRLRGQSDYSMLSDILASVDNREFFLDVKRSIPLKPDTIRSDAAKVLNYANSQDYAIWSQEAWSEVIVLVHKLKSDDLSGAQADYYRGALASAMKLLEISYKAHRLLQERREAKN